MKAGSNLEKLLRKGEFVVTAELGPPKGNDLNVVKKKASYLKGYVDAVNVTDNQTAVVRMSSIAVCSFLVQWGIEPIMQMTCRDRNRIAIQSDIFGATALGIKNCLCLTGDHQVFGNQPDAKNVFDIDSIQLLMILKRMRDEGKIWGVDEPVEGDIKLFLGAAANPFGDPFEFRVIRLAKKVKAGADFIQTQVIYDMERFKEWMKQVRNMGLHEKVYILAGLMPLKSGGMARYMAKNVPGVIVPDNIVERMVRASAKKRGGEEGIKILLEQIEQVREIEGVAGVHIMALEWEEKVPEIVKRAGLYPRPKVS